MKALVRNRSNSDSKISVNSRGRKTLRPRCLCEAPYIQGLSVAQNQVRIALEGDLPAHSDVAVKVILSHGTARSSDISYITDHRSLHANVIALAAITAYDVKTDTLYCKGSPALDNAFKV